MEAREMGGRKNKVPCCQIDAPERARLNAKEAEMALGLHTDLERDKSCSLWGSRVKAREISGTQKVVLWPPERNQNRDNKAMYYRGERQAHGASLGH